MLFAMKRLSSVEIGRRDDPTTSHQHEFNANRLRTQLGFGEQPTRGNLTLLFFRDGQSVTPDADHCAYALYNSRQGKPRAAEYRLYYSSKRVGEWARQGDLFVLFRTSPDSTDLVGVVARSATQHESALLAGLRVDPRATLRSFIAAEPKAITQETSRTLLGTVSANDEHPILAMARSSGRVPSAKQIQAAAAAEVSTSLDPDTFLAQSLDAESRLFFAAEEVVKGRELAFMVETKQATLKNVLQFAISTLQSRKARRGDSLQFHFERLLTSRKIPYTPQAETENGETPDILVPGQSYYRNPSYPANLLRMVACKSTVRERWSQVSREAMRIDEKFLLTVDEDIAHDTIANMTHNHRIFPFTTAQIKAVSYSSIDLVRTVSTLLDLLGGAVQLAAAQGLLRRRD